MMNISPTPAQPLRLLLVEDDPGHARLTREWLHDADPFGFVITHAATLTEAQMRLKEGDFDLAALDLGLPDSQGLATLKAMHQAAPDLPIVVLTGHSDESQGVAAVEAGAQDYLVKGRFEPEYLLSRTLKYAVERHQLQQRIDAEREQIQRQRELLALEQLGRNSAPVTALLYSQTVLADYDPVLFQTLVDRYCKLLEQAVERQVFKVAHTVSRDLATLAERLGFLKAGPRDVIDLHSRALEMALRDSAKYAAKFYTDEGRLMALELMGYLVNYYRRFYRDSLQTGHAGQSGNSG
ncbi:MAG: response regulator [Candidatus Competibacteraceae bacterium]|nr:MAG: response regulator [Candidatus Competibacteraceae bacterium]